MELIDTHAHLYLNQFDEDIHEVIQRSVNHHVNKIILPNLDSHSVEAMLRLTGKYPENLFPTIGLHPTSVKSNYEDELKSIEEWLSKEKFYAIGEIGIDLYWDKTYLREQVIAFKHQIELAKKHHLPVIIHTRESYSEVLSIIDELNDETLNGVFHSFTGNREQAVQIIHCGFKIGIGGIVTFKNSGLGEVVKDIDLQNVVVETDAPFLSPVPKRGKRNESAYVRYIAEKLAEIHHCSLQQIADTTTKNAVNLFQLDR